MKNKILSILTMITINNSLQAQEISSEFPFKSKFLLTGEDKIHYVEDGAGDPVLFLHGIPMSSYSWRNIIPHVSKSARCIAIDFMGFGKSDRPDIDYTFADQYRYLEAFIDSLQLKNVILVMTDIGGVLGMRYAKHHPKNIKGMIFMEVPLGDAETFHKNGGMMQHMLFWMGGKNKLGYKMIVKKNMFIKMMGMLIKRKLSTEEKEFYKAPFLEESARKPLFILPNSFPKKGKHAQKGDMADFINENNSFLTKTTIPKLLLHAKPGMLINKKVLRWVEGNISTIDTKFLGRAKHLMEEDLPHEIGESINSWYSKLK